MWYVVVGVVLVSVALLCMILFLSSHIKERDEWVRAWVAEVYQKHNSLYGLVKELKERLDETDLALADLSLDRRVSGGLQHQYPRGTATGSGDAFRAGLDTDTGPGREGYASPDEAAVLWPDIATNLTFPHTLRECCADNRPDDCPSWRVIGDLCIDLWSADTVR